MAILTLIMMFAVVYVVLTSLPYMKWPFLIFVAGVVFQGLKAHFNPDSKPDSKQVGYRSQEEYDEAVRRRIERENRPR